MILVKVVELIINKDRRCHWLGNFEGESAVGVDVADVVVSDPNLLDLVGKDDHWYSDCEEDEGEREEECYCLGECGNWKPSSQHVLLQLVQEGVRLIALIFLQFLGLFFLFHCF